MNVFEVHDFSLNTYTEILVFVFMKYDKTHLLTLVHVDSMLKEKLLRICIQFP